MERGPGTPIYIDFHGLIGPPPCTSNPCVVPWWGHALRWHCGDLRKGHLSSRSLGHIIKSPSVEMKEKSDTPIKETFGP